MNADLLWIIGISVACALSFTFTDTLAAFWAKAGSNRALIGVIIIAPVSYIIFGILNTRIDLARAGGLVNGLVVLFTGLSAVIIFKGVLQWWQYLGIGLIIVGIVLTLWQPKEF